MKNNYIIRKAEKRDIIEIAKIQLDCWHMAYKNICNNYELYEKRDLNSTIKTIENLYEDNTLNILVYSQERVKGFLIYKRGTESDLKNSFEIVKLFVNPAVIRSGIGKSLLMEFEKIALELNGSVAYLWTLKENIIAGKFYQKNSYIRDIKIKHNKDWNVESIRYIKKLK